MTHWWRATWAMASLSICEIGRQKTWIVLLAVIAVMLVALASLQAVDASAQLKLSVVTISGSINFISTLFAILLVAATITRDREQLVSLTLFPKPLPMSAYVCGRWLGVQIAIAIGVLILNTLGTLVVHLTADHAIPEMRTVHKPVDWQRVDIFGETSPLDTKRVTLTGTKKGGAIRWDLAKLPTNQGDLVLLLKGRLRAIDPAHYQSHIAVSARPSESAQQTLLVCSDESPYGSFRPDGKPVESGATMKDKGDNHVDLNQDYMRFRLAQELISPEGTCIITVTRNDINSSLSFKKFDSCLIALSGGGFFTNMQRGGCVVLAQVGYLTAIALLCACFSNIGVTLLAGLTAFFGALTLSYIQDMTGSGKLPNFLVRFLELMQFIIPDFNRYGVEGTLAGGQAVGWPIVMDAWFYYGTFSLSFLLIAWFVMLRREL